MAWLLRRYGEPIREFIEKRLGLLAALGCAVLIALFFAGQYLDRERFAAGVPLLISATGRAHEVPGSAMIALTTASARLACAHALIGAACLTATAALAQTANPVPADPPAVIEAPPPSPQTSAPLLPNKLPTPQETFGAIGRFIDQSISSVWCRRARCGRDARRDHERGGRDRQGRRKRGRNGRAAADHQYRFGTRVVSGGAERRAGLHRRERRAVQDQRLRARPEPRHHVVLQVPGADVARGPRAEPAGMHRRVLRLARDLPIRRCSPPSDL